MKTFAEIDAAIGELEAERGRILGEQAARAEAARVTAARQAGAELSRLVSEWNRHEAEGVEIGMRLLLLAHQMHAEIPKLGLTATTFTTPPTDRGYPRAWARQQAAWRAGLDRSVHEAHTHNPDVVVEVT